MPTFDLESFAEHGVLREAAFRDALDRYDWESLRDKSVHIRGCGAIPLPTWAYVMATARIAQYARRISYGEEQAPIPVFDREPAVSM